jgi:membrane-bound ClpP family serine protease
VEIEDEIFDAVSEDGFISKGEDVKVIKDEAGQIYVMKV